MRTQFWTLPNSRTPQQQHHNDDDKFIEMITFDGSPPFLIVIIIITMIIMIIVIMMILMIMITLVAAPIFAIICWTGPAIDILLARSANTWCGHHHNHLFHHVCLYTTKNRLMVTIHSKDVT